DVELGATEQKFNLLVGRVFQELHGQPPQIALTLPVLPGLDGVQRMSKTLGNYIGVTDSPAEMFGKTMSIPDRTMLLYWKLVTDADGAELARIEKALADPKLNPMDIKKQLGERLVTMYQGADLAKRACADFETQFSRREVPEDVEEYRWPAVEQAIGHSASATIVEHLVGSGMASSKSVARRLIEQGAVTIDGEKVSDIATAPA